MKQGSKEWLELRKNYIGASDAACLMGFHQWKTPKKLWEEKLGFQSEIKDSYSMKYGREMEEPARQMYSQITGYHVNPDIVFHPSKSFMMASLDGLSDDKQVAVEIKNVCLEDHLFAKDGKVPDKYYPQVQHQLACLGLDMMHYFSVNKGDTALIEVKASKDYLERLYEVEQDFWDKVLNLEVPELVDADLIFRGQSWNEKAKRAFYLKQQIAILKKEESLVINELKKDSESKSSCSDEFRFKKSMMKGRIDYKKIPILKDYDLTPYVGKDTERWTLTKI